MWKPFLCQRAYAAADGEGVWLGDRRYAVRFPSQIVIEPSRIEPPLPRAVVLDVLVIDGRPVLLLDDGRALPLALRPDPEAERVFTQPETDAVGWFEMKDILAAARAAFAEAGDPFRSGVMLRPAGRGLVAVPVAAGRELAPKPMRGEVASSLFVPGGLLRLASWAGMRGGEVGIHRAGRDLLIIAEDPGGCVYLLRW